MTFVFTKRRIGMLSSLTMIATSEPEFQVRSRGALGHKETLVYFIVMLMEDQSLKYSCTKA